MAKRIITISREFGSGGREIGERLAKELGYAFYDKELICEIAKISKLSEEFVEKRLESSPRNSLLSYIFVKRGWDGTSKEDFLFDVQKRLIEEIARKECCVIVGRCADAILKGRDDVLSVFICADDEEKTKRIMERYGIGEKQAARMCKDTDKKRSSNHNYYTDGVWGMASCYGLSVNSSMLGYEGCINLIAKMAREL